MRSSVLTRDFIRRLRLLQILSGSVTGHLTSLLQRGPASSTLSHPCCSSLTQTGRPLLYVVRDSGFTDELARRIQPGLNEAAEQAQRKDVSV